ncbi:MAG: hypothetical protein IJ366_02540 [Clostridia bacterium]|nr:hypothetical protein [Clostridia bacterium]
MKNKALIGVFAAVIAAIALIIVLVATGGNTAEEAQDNVETNMTETALPDVEAEMPAETPETEKEEESKPSEPTPDADNTASEEKVYTPTFMYFVSTADASYEAATKVVDELKKEYDGKVTFDIKDVDKDPKLLENFALVNGNIPTLIMLNTKNEISNILLKNSDKEQLSSAIEQALK